MPLLAGRIHRSYCAVLCGLLGQRLMKIEILRPKSSVPITNAINRTSHDILFRHEPGLFAFRNLYAALGVPEYGNVTLGLPSNLKPENTASTA